MRRFSTQLVETRQTRDPAGRASISEHRSQFDDHRHKLYVRDFALYLSWLQNWDALADLCDGWFLARDLRLAHPDPGKNSEAQEAMETKASAD